MRRQVAFQRPCAVRDCAQFGCHFVLIMVMMMTLFEQLLEPSAAFLDIVDTIDSYAAVVLLPLAFFLAFRRIDFSSFLARARKRIKKRFCELSPSDSEDFESPDPPKPPNHLSTAIFDMAHTEIPPLSSFWAFGCTFSSAIVKMAYTTISVLAAFWALGRDSTIAIFGMAYTMIFWLLALVSRLLTSSCCIKNAIFNMADYILSSVSAFGAWAKNAYTDISNFTTSRVSLAFSMMEIFCGWLSATYNSTEILPDDFCERNAYESSSLVSRPLRWLWLCAKLLAQSESVAAVFPRLRLFWSAVVLSSCSSPSDSVIGVPKPCQSAAKLAETIAVVPWSISSPVELEYRHFVTAAWETWKREQEELKAAEDYARMAREENERLEREARIELEERREKEKKKREKEEEMRAARARRAQTRRAKRRADRKRNSRPPDEERNDEPPAPSTVDAASKNDDSDDDDDNDKLDSGAGPIAAVVISVANSYTISVAAALQSPENITLESGPDDDLVEDVVETPPPSPFAESVVLESSDSTTVVENGVQTPSESEQAPAPMEPSPSVGDLPIPEEKIQEMGFGQTDDSDSDDDDERPAPGAGAIAAVDTSLNTSNEVSHDVVRAGPANQQTIFDDSPAREDSTSLLSSEQVSALSSLLAGLVLGGGAQTPSQPESLTPAPMEPIAPADPLPAPRSSIAAVSTNPAVISRSSEDAPAPEADFAAQSMDAIIEMIESGEEMDLDDFYYEDSADVGHSQTSSNSACAGPPVQMDTANFSSAPLSDFAQTSNAAGIHGLLGWTPPPSQQPIDGMGDVPSQPPTMSSLASLSPALLRLTQPSPSELDDSSRRHVISNSALLEAEANFQPVVAQLQQLRSCDDIPLAAAPSPGNVSEETGNFQPGPTPLSPATNDDTASEQADELMSGIEQDEFSEMLRLAIEQAEDLQRISDAAAERASAAARQERDEDLDYEMEELLEAGDRAQPGDEFWRSSPTPSIDGDQTTDNQQLNGGTGPSSTAQSAAPQSTSVFSFGASVPAPTAKPVVEPSASTFDFDFNSDGYDSSVAPSASTFDFDFNGDGYDPSVAPSASTFDFDFNGDGYDPSVAPSASTFNFDFSSDGNDPSVAAMGQLFNFGPPPPTQAPSSPSVAAPRASTFAFGAQAPPPDFSFGAPAPPHAPFFSSAAPAAPSPSFGAQTPQQIAPPAAPAPPSAPFDFGDVASMPSPIFGALAGGNNQAVPSAPAAAANQQFVFADQSTLDPSLRDPPAAAPDPTDAFTFSAPIPAPPVNFASLPSGGIFTFSTPAPPPPSPPSPEPEEEEEDDTIYDEEGRAEGVRARRPNLIKASVDVPLESLFDTAKMDAADKAPVLGKGHIPKLDDEEEEDNVEEEGEEDEQEEEGGEDEEEEEEGEDDGDENMNEGEDEESGSPGGAASGSLPKRHDEDERGGKDQNGHDNGHSDSTPSASGQDDKKQPLQKMAAAPGGGDPEGDDPSDDDDEPDDDDDLPPWDNRALRNVNLADFRFPALDGRLSQVFDLAANAAYNAALATKSRSEQRRELNLRYNSLTMLLSMKLRNDGVACDSETILPRFLAALRNENAFGKYGPRVAGRLEDVLDNLPHFASLRSKAASEPEWSRTTCELACQWAGISYGEDGFWRVIFWALKLLEVEPKGRGDGGVRERGEWAPAQNAVSGMLRELLAIQIYQSGSD